MYIKHRVGVAVKQLSESLFELRQIVKRCYNRSCVSEIKQAEHQQKKKKIGNKNNNNTGGNNNNNKNVPPRKKTGKGHFCVT